MFFIYGKFKGQKRYKPIGRVDDYLRLVSRKIYALVWKDKDKAKEALEMLKAFNPDIEFKLVED